MSRAKDRPGARANALADPRIGRWPRDKITRIVMHVRLHKTRDFSRPYRRLAIRLRPVLSRCVHIWAGPRGRPLQAISSTIDQLPGEPDLLSGNGFVSFQAFCSWRAERAPAARSGSSELLLLGVTSLCHPKHADAHHGHYCAHDGCGLNRWLNVLLGKRMRIKLPYERDESSTKVQREKHAKCELDPMAVGRLQPESHRSFPLQVPPQRPAHHRE